MDAQLNIDSLITAARLLEKGQLLTALGIPASFPLSATISIPTSAQMNQVNNENFAPCDYESSEYGNFTGKIRVERKCAASTSAVPYCTSPVKKSTKHSRAAHNELEKTRRANLRTYLEKLKSLVPPVSDAARNTTLALLTRARDHIQQLDAANAESEAALIAARQRNAELREELERQRAEAQRREDSPSGDSRVSPFFIEYSPSSKLQQSPRPTVIDPIAEGLLPELPICYPRPTAYPFFDLNPPAAYERSFLPIHLSV